MTKSEILRIVCKEKPYVHSSASGMSVKGASRLQETPVYLTHSSAAWVLEEQALLQSGPSPELVSV